MHIDKIDNDHAADVAEPELTRYFARRLAIDGKNRFFPVGIASELRCINVYNGERLCTVDHYRAAVVELDFVFEELFHLAEHAVLFEYVVILNGRYLDGLSEVLVEVIGERFRYLRAVANYLVDGGIEYIAHGTEQKIAVRRQKLYAAGRSVLVQQRNVHIGKILDLRDYIRASRVLCRRPRYKSAVRFDAVLGQKLDEPLARFLVRYLVGYADKVDSRHIHDVPTGYRQMRRKPRTFGVRRFFYRLNEQILALFYVELGGNCARVRERRAILEHVRRGEKTVLFKSDIDERRLQTGQDVDDFPLVDIARDPVHFAILDVKLF